MNSQRIFWIALAVGVVLVYWKWEGRPVVHPPGILVAEAPVQTPVEPMEIQLGDYRLTQRARFDIRARVLSRRDYGWDDGSDLSPIDLALGWGPMSDQLVLDEIDVRQSGRWYHLRWGPSGPLPEQEVMRHSGNMHMVPADGYVLDQLESIREGQVVRLEGYLVDASRPDGYRWKTSLSRNDTGGGSCELFFVERVLIEEP